MLISAGFGHEHFWTSGTDQAEEGKYVELLYSLQNIFQLYSIMTISLFKRLFEKATNHYFRVFRWISHGHLAYWNYFQILLDVNW